MSPCSAWFGYDHFHASFSVINIGVGQLLRNDIAKVINAKVKLLPALSTSFAVFGGGPKCYLFRSWFGLLISLKVSLARRRCRPFGI